MITKREESSEREKKKAPSVRETERERERVKKNDSKEEDAARWFTLITGQHKRPLE